MNTCESTDQIYLSLASPAPVPLTPHAVLDIGNKLNAKNYVGWDCSVLRDVSIHVPTMLMQAFDTYWDAGAQKFMQRTTSSAVGKVRSMMQAKQGNHYVFSIRLNAVRSDNTTFDLNNEPN
jgi:hypothetical protein